MTATTDDLLRGLAKAKAALEEHGAILSAVEITRAQYELLKAECLLPCPGTPDRIMGLRVIVKEDGTE